MSEGYTPPPSPKSGGLDSNVAAALSYLWIAGIIFLFIEPFNKDRFVRFHSFQSIFIMVAEIVLSTVLTITIVGILILPIVMLATLALRIMCALKAYQNEAYKAPIIGDMAEKQAGA